MPGVGGRSTKCRSAEKEFLLIDGREEEKKYVLLPFLISWRRPTADVVRDGGWNVDFGV